MIPPAPRKIQRDVVRPDCQKDDIDSVRKIRQRGPESLYVASDPLQLLGELLSVAIVWMKNQNPQ